MTGNKIPQTDSIHGKTAEEALGNLEEALELYLQHTPRAEIMSYLTTAKSQ